MSRTVVNRRHYAMTLLVALVVLTAVIGIAQWTSDPSPSWSTFEKVQEGMTSVEVIATVGGLPTDSISMKNGTVLELWDADDGSLWVVFDRDGYATLVGRHRRKPPTFWEQFRARSGV